jgi:hypothetical protein
MLAISWGWALFVWGYALAWFLVSDRVKLLADQIFDPVKTAKVRTPSDLTLQIAKQAYALYEQQGHHDGHDVQNWLQSEQMIKKDGSAK